MRRRRQKNPLLMRIVMISIGLHILALPVLAHFGVLKKVQEKFIETQMVVLPPPPAVEKQKPVANAEKKTARKSASTGKKSAASNAHNRLAAHRSNLSQPKVIAGAAAGGDGDDGGPTVDANGSGKAGELPTAKTDTKTGSKGDSAGSVVPVKRDDTPAAKPEAVKVAKNDVKPAPEPVKTTAPAPKAPVLTDVEPTYSPQPSIPDDLRTDALDKTFVAEFVVSASGTPSDVKVAQSTGNDELDRLALDTAKKWKFKPATRDGQPIESRIRLHIEFQVS